MNNLFDLSNKIIVITGGAGFLGKQHAEAIASFGGIPVLLDLSQAVIDEFSKELSEKYNLKIQGFEVNITNEDDVARICNKIISLFGKIDVLINNAANNPKVNAVNALSNPSRLENFSLDTWNQDIAVGLTGSFLCTKYFGYEMAKAKKGNIINISSDLGIIAPNQNLYKQSNVSDDRQNVKPISYSVVKSGLIGLTRYLATYWADRGVRCNAICPGGVFNGQGEEFVRRISKLIPLGRMAEANEYQGAIIYLASDASSYMNGSVVVIDGGRSCW